MTDREIREQMKKFSDEIFAPLTIEQAKDVRRRIDEFVEKNNVTFEQRQILAETGAGEMLYMLLG